ncbi:MAG: hypothetical protein VKJ46_13755 [Leptolyngbyaceae bacterium]|nr:hypothetical protein [Leptolyngbyaceae bacterium]
MVTTPADDFLPLQRFSHLPTLIGRYDPNQKCDSANQAVHQFGLQEYDSNDTSRKVIQYRIVYQSW